MTKEPEQTDKMLLIDVDKIVSQKNPELYRKLPRFVLKFLKKIIHQKEFNEFIVENNQYKGIYFLRRSFEHFNINAEIINKENLPDNNKTIFVSNHPIGSFDGLHMINLLYSQYGKVKAVVNDILMSVKNLNDFFIGVNKHGKTPREQLEELNHIFESDVPVFFFPAGLVSRRKNKKIEDTDWKKTFIVQAIKHKRDVVPVFIEGKLSNKFYRLANLRTLLNIKTNIEMLYLPDELIKQRGKTLKISIGKAIPYSKFDQSKSSKEWAQLVKQHVYKIENDKSISF